MKLILKQYLASLRERSELDAILPDLLSSMGMNVFISPTRGVKEYGVDIAAVGNIDGSGEKVYLFSVKSGNLTRETWMGNSEQALMRSLEEIRYGFLPSRMPTQHRSKPVVICLCFGGDVSPSIRQEVSGYQARHSDEGLSIEEWNGDKLSEHILTHLLKEELLPKDYQSNLRKAIALLDEAKESSEYFVRLTDSILDNANDAKSIASAITKLNICLWVLFAWCREERNLESAYLSSEYAVLAAWNKVKKNYSRNKPSRAFDSVLDTYQVITDEYVERCLTPYAGIKHAISHAVMSPCSIDVNTKLFDLLGRIAVKGLWILESISRNCAVDSLGNYESKDVMALQERLENTVETIKLLVMNNPLLLSPYKDSQAIDIGLALCLLSNNSEHDDFVKSWLAELIDRSTFSFVTNGMYPTIMENYDELLEHKGKEEHDIEYKRKVTNASILYPLLILFCALHEMDKECSDIESFYKEHLQHTTMQYWHPNQDSEDFMYVNVDSHGLASTGFPIAANLVLQHVLEECKHANFYHQMSAVSRGYRTLVFVACRSYRYPMPLHVLEDWLDLQFERTDQS